MNTSDNDRDALIALIEETGTGETAYFRGAGAHVPIAPDSGDLADALLAAGYRRSALAAAATPAPPVDVAARLLAASEAAEATDASICTIVELRQLGRDRLPSEPPHVVEAIARALTGEATP